MRKIEVRPGEGPLVQRRGAWVAGNFSKSLSMSCTNPPVRGQVPLVSLPASCY